MIVDLHCHSTASDGALPPRELLRRAQARGVDMLAITDHDTVAAYAEFDAADAAGLRVVPGIEFSSRWRGHTVHVVGLGIDTGSARLAVAIEAQQRARARRAEEIAARLAPIADGDPLAAAREIAGERPPGRPDFARYLVATGRVKSVSAAFAKYLGPGKRGDVRHFWPAIETVVGWIQDAGGVAVLAHPGKYGLTNAKRVALVEEFSAAGGRAIEVLCGRQRADLTKKLARVCDDFGLFASCGSDFHAPDRPWAELGGCGALPTDCRPVWELL